MSLGGCAVDALDVRGVEDHQTCQDTRPNPSLRPSIEPIVDGRVRTVILGAIFPAATDLQDMNDTADDLAVPARFYAAPFLGDCRLDRRELLIAQPEQVRHRCSLRREASNRTSRSQVNRKLGFDPSAA